MTNFEKYQYALAKLMLDSAPFRVSKATGNVEDCDFARCDDCIFKKGKSCTSYEKAKAWANEEYKEPILDDVERKYLGDVIRPFRDDIECITKLIKYEGYERIWIYFYSYKMPFPPFKAGTMYKGMETSKEYTLKELGL